MVVGCDGTFEGRNAVVLAAAIAAARFVRPDALVEPVVDLSVPRALRRFAQRRHADLVVLGI
jgi:hypothetical protein